MPNVLMKGGSLKIPKFCFHCQRIKFDVKVRESFKFFRPINKIRSCPECFEKFEQELMDYAAQYYSEDLTIGEKCATDR